MAKIVVAYATKYGSTRAVAEAIAEVLRQRGLEVDLATAREVTARGEHALDGYRGVVLGSPMYIGSLLREMRTLLTRQQAALAALPVAFFAPGPLQPATQLQGGREQLDAALAKWPWFRPVAVTVVGGTYDPAALRFPDSLLAKLKASPLYGQPAVDARDWDAIRAWASAAGGLLVPRD